MKNPRNIVFQELSSPSEVVALLRLRHRVYFEQQGYGARKPLRLDLTAHDERSRLCGVFQEGTLVGGARIVYRSAQPLAEIFRALREVADEPPEPKSSELPSEEAFDLFGNMGEERASVDAEISRLALQAGAVSPRLIDKVMLACLAALYVQPCRLYLYSCAKSMARRYARVTNPRFAWEVHQNPGIASDQFTFPKPTVARVAAVEDSPYLDVIETFAQELRRSGSIDLSADRPELHYSHRPPRYVETSAEVIY